MDIGTGIAIFGVADLIKKLIGPSADYLGNELKSYTEKGAKNLKIIFSNATDILGSKINEPGQIPPRALHYVLREGYFCEDELMAEYFGGLLAASRSQDEWDDRASTYIQLVSRMSTYQIRIHYILYSCIKNLYNGQDIKMGMVEERFKHCYTFIPIDEYLKVFETIDDNEVINLMHHIFDGLSREFLIEENWVYGTWPYIEKIDCQFGEGICFVPSGLGIELYIWAHGLRNCSVEKFLHPDTIFNSKTKIQIPQNCRCAKGLLTVT